jgi:SAM-dependent methyltransferase
VAEDQAHDAKLEGLEARIAQLEAAINPETLRFHLNLCVERAQEAIRKEYTTLPRFAYHLPFDYEAETLPPQFDAAVFVESEPLPLPPPAERHGNVTDDSKYLNWGRYDYDFIMRHINEAFPSIEGLAIMDFGCSSGRVLRHFYKNMCENQFQLTGVDVSARQIEWLRRNFPPEFRVYTGSILPILPFESNSFDVIYGMSVFTHIKFLWDMWLLELRRTLKPGGLLILTIHTEYAWDFFYRNSQNVEWNPKNFGGLVINRATMDHDFSYIGDIDTSHVFWKKEIARQFWGRYFRDVQIFPPPDEFNYQDWVVSRK